MSIDVSDLSSGLFSPGSSSGLFSPVSDSGLFSPGSSSASEFSSLCSTPQPQEVLPEIPSEDVSNNNNVGLILLCFSSF